MCGINVILGKTNKKAQHDIEAMMRSTAHRGPDYSAWNQVGASLFMAGNRLKILDMSEASNQPLWNQEKNAVLVWNGALYNYQDLRNSLLHLGYFFETNSDSEVLLHWLKHYGKNGLKDLKGMFALAFADLDKQELLIARDPSGEKPLSFAEHKNNWYFSSEARAIKEITDSRIDISQFMPYFYVRHPFPKGSLFADISQVLAGQAMLLDFDGKKKECWDLGKQHLPMGKFDPNRLEEVLKDAVLKNFHTERPLGVMLSGGADSSLIYALWYEETGQALPTYTITFDHKYQKNYCDPNFANKFNKHYPSFHQEVKIDLTKVKENWPAFIQSLDQPIGDSAGFLTWMLAKEASTAVKVLISGAGADELFGGYNRHQAFLQYLKHPNFWENIKKLGIHQAFPASLKKMIGSIGETQQETFIQMSALQQIPSHYLPLFTALYPSSGNPMKDALEWDRVFYLVNDILKIHDNACMAHGIEGRSPYLDQELISISLGLSETQHREQIGKKWIKEALQKRNLGFISNRKKLGFGLPLREWMANKEFQEWVCPAIKQLEKDWGQHFPDEMRTLAKAPDKAKGREFLQVWNLFLLASWLEQYGK